MYNLSVLLRHNIFVRSSLYTDVNLGKQFIIFYTETCKVAVYSIEIKYTIGRTKYNQLYLRNVIKE